MQLLCHHYVLLCTGLLITGTAPASGQSRGRTAPPNIILVVSDDHPAAMVSAYRNARVPPDEQFTVTPNLDALASAGVRCTGGYCQYPVCSPARATLLTGRYPDQTGVVNPGLIFSWPGQLPEATVRAGLIEHVDIMPTILDLAGIAIPDSVQGRSVKDELLGGPPVNPYVFCQAEGAYMICDGRYKLTQGFALQDLELYDLVRDPAELVNELGNSALDPIRAQLRARLLAFRNGVYK
ncbi:MAG: hypothetical protein EYC70_09665 [Planctomycetota bacterium]|nr:MAG: hypothetical protein EYC70_09665 [Planctomycetota bacterium]